MKLNDFDYQLPVELIADRPLQKRDTSRLLVMDRENKTLNDLYFSNLLDYLNNGDVLVLNNSKVFPARLIGKKETGGQVEILLNYEIEAGLWEAIGKRIGNSKEIGFDYSALKAEIVTNGENVIVKFNLTGNQFDTELEKIGKVPLPPYIEKKRENKKIDCNDSERYQTVYAKEKGSCAAPTAGLHFTKELLDKIKEKGVKICEVTLHVGLGTFWPIQTEEIEDHKIHREHFSIDKKTLSAIIEAREKSGRIVAVGTTTARVLETVFSQPEKYENFTQHISGWTDIYIYPGYKFSCVDALITNFHLPKSSLILLVSALAGREAVLQAYKHAIKNKYRFYSYGDAMLIV